jgi:hypothetical protein
MEKYTFNATVTHMIGQINVKGNKKFQSAQDLQDANEG